MTRDPKLGMTREKIIASRDRLKWRLDLLLTGAVMTGSIKREIAGTRAAINVYNKMLGEQDGSADTDRGRMGGA